VHGFVSEYKRMFRVVSF